MPILVFLIIFSAGVIIGKSTDEPQPHHYCGDQQPHDNHGCK